MRLVVFIVMVIMIIIAVVERIKLRKMEDQMVDYLIKNYKKDEA